MDPLRDVLDALADLSAARPRRRQRAGRHDAACLPLLAPAADPEDDSRQARLRRRLRAPAGRRCTRNYPILATPPPMRGGPSNHDGRRRRQHLRDRARGGGRPSRSNCARCDGATRWSRRRRRSRQRWGSTCTCSWRASGARLERLAASASTRSAARSAHSAWQCTRASPRIRWRCSLATTRARCSRVGRRRRPASAWHGARGLPVWSRYRAQRGGTWRRRGIVSQADGVSSMIHAYPSPCPPTRRRARLARCSCAAHAHRTPSRPTTSIALAAAGARARHQHALELTLLREGTLADAALRPLLRLRFAKQRAPVVRVLRGVARSLPGRDATVWGSSSGITPCGSRRALRSRSSAEHACAARTPPATSVPRSAAAPRWRPQQAGGTALARRPLGRRLHHAAGRARVADATGRERRRAQQPARTGGARGARAGAGRRRCAQPALSAEYRRLQQPVIQTDAFVGELELHKATATIVGACVAACAARAARSGCSRTGGRRKGGGHPRASSCYCRCARLRSPPTASSVAAWRRDAPSPSRRRLSPGRFRRALRAAASSSGGPPRSAMAMPLLTHGRPWARCCSSTSAAAAASARTTRWRCAACDGGCRDAAPRRADPRAIHARIGHLLANLRHRRPAPAPARAALALVGVQAAPRPVHAARRAAASPRGLGPCPRAAYATEQLALSEETYDFALRAAGR